MIFSNYMYLDIKLFIVYLYYYRTICQIIQIEEWSEKATN